MAHQESGQNTLIIHLVDPYKCGNCESEFCARSVFLEHFNDHIEKLKVNSPCNQIVCSIGIVEHQPNTITVTRDILQINEKEVFVLQDHSFDNTQLTPLKTLEQAGILVLPPPQQVSRLPDVPKDPSPVILTVQENNTKADRRKISYLGNQHPYPPEENHFQMQVVDDLRFNNAPQLCVQAVMDVESLPSDLDAMVQQTFIVDKIKEELHVTLETSGHNDPSILIGGSNQENYFEVKKLVQPSKKSVSCPTCFNIFANANVLERHQVTHTRLKPYPCMKCFKPFNDATSMRKHMLIHKRQHRCPICHKIYLLRSQLSMHMKQHSKRRFIQFGNSFHEVKVHVTRSETGQQVQQYSLLILMTEDELKKHEANTSVDNIDEVTCNNSVEVVSQADQNSILSGSGDAQLKFDHLDLTKKIIYKCGHCKKLIFTRPTLCRHLIKHTNTKPFQCDTCLKTFRDKADLFHHSKTHSKPVQCNTCLTSFSKLLYLQNHLLKGCPMSNSDTRFTVLDNLKCQCNVCKKVLKNKANVLRHLRVHAFQESQKKEQSATEGAAKDHDMSAEGLSQNANDHFKALNNSVGFECLVCGQEFRFKSFMITHVRMHLNQRPYQCEQCSKRFFAMHMLKKHIQNHTRPYKCPACGKGFIRRYLMKDHYRKRHEQTDQEDPMKDITELYSEKKIQCDICGKTMKSFQKSLMQHHIRQHRDVRPFVCQVCQRAFTSDNALKKHTLNHSRPYICQVCKQGFSRRYLLTDHYKKKCARKNQVKEMLPSAINSEAELNVGNVKNEFTSDYSVNSTFQPTLLTEVNTTTGATTFVCQPCNKTFTVYEALLRHINTFAKPTSCKYCSTVFNDKHLAVSHQRSCLGVPVGTPQKIKTVNIEVLGEKQEKVKKIMKDISEKIEQMATTSENDQDKHILTFSHLDSSTSEAGMEIETLKQTQKLTTVKTLLALKDEKGKYQCPECEKMFTSLRGMKIHASSHVRLFKCEVCSQDFTNISQLRTHAKTHKNEHGTAVNEKSVIVTLEQQSKEEDIASSEKEENEKTTISTKQDITTTPKNMNLPKKRKKDDDDGDETKLTTKTILEVNQRLMCSGTRGRPFSCKLCRRRFTEASGLDNHMIQNHGVKT